MSNQGKRGPQKPREPVWCGCIKPLAFPGHPCKRCYGHVPTTEEFEARGFASRPLAPEPLDV